MTAIQKKPDNVIAHLSRQDIEDIGAELDAIRASVLASRGEEDAAYIRKLIKAQRSLELASRALLLFSLFPPAWLVGTAGVSVARIVENLEIGHNVMHGQWDWMRDPKIHSTTWEWDHATSAELWKHLHDVHHTYTNVLGKDNDLGFGFMRVDEDQPWTPFYLGQPLWTLINACMFEHTVALYDLEIPKNWATRGEDPEFQRKARAVVKKVRAQATKDFVVHPLMSGISAPTTFAANLTSQLLRNLWSHSVTMCSHFPEGVETFETASIDAETRGDWYVRQMLGAANLDGNQLLHLMSGNLSFQIEHHIFPDLPSNRYAEIAPQVRTIFERYDLPYVTGPLPRQLASAWKKVFRLSLPNDFLRKATSARTPMQAVAVVTELAGAGATRPERMAA